MCFGSYNNKSGKFVQRCTVSVSHKRSFERSMWHEGFVTLSIVSLRWCGRCSPRAILQPDVDADMMKPVRESSGAQRGKDVTSSNSESGGKKCAPPAHDTIIRNVLIARMDFCLLFT